MIIKCPKCGAAIAGPEPKPVANNESRIKALVVCNKCGGRYAVEISAVTDVKADDVSAGCA